MPDEEDQGTRMIPIKDVCQQGVTALNLVYGAFESVSKQNGELKAKISGLESENKKMSAELKRLKDVKEMLNKFLSGDEDDQDSDISAETG